MLDVTLSQMLHMLDVNIVVMKMTLVSALVHIFKCHTCLHRRDTPDGVTPIFPADKCADEHFANNHIITCLICTTAIFHGTWSKGQS